MTPHIFDKDTGETFDQIHGTPANSAGQTVDGSRQPTETIPSSRPDHIFDRDTIETYDEMNRSIGAVGKN